MEGIWEYEEDHLEAEEAEEAEEAPEPNRKKAKKPVLNPRPKLDTDLLLDDDKGLPQLLRMTSSITFKGGQELKSMKRTLAVTELWAHRLFSRLTFDDFIDKCDNLGHKRAIKSHLRKTRQNQTTG